ncbi:MAG: hypothetical protein ABJ375_04115 [Rhizobiaceae bacterium]
MLKKLFAVAAAITSGGTLYSESIAKKKPLIYFAMVFAAISGIYMVRSSVVPDAAQWGSFASAKCLAIEEESGELYEIRAFNKAIPVRDFRRDATVIVRGEYPSYLIVDDATHQVLFDPRNSRFTIILILQSSSPTPNEVANQAGRAIQKALCLEKSAICDLDHEIISPRATNSTYPELSGQRYKFSFCQ